MAEKKEGKGFYFHKEHESDKVWHVRYPRIIGCHAVSFDRKRTLNLFEDNPWRFTPEEKALFDKENPYWADFFKNRK